MGLFNDTLNEGVPSGAKKAKAAEKLAKKIIDIQDVIADMVADLDMDEMEDFEDYVREIKDGRVEQELLDGMDY